MPQAIASVTTRPKGSGQSIGKEHRAGAAEHVDLHRVRRFVEDRRRRRRDGGRRPRPSTLFSAGSLRLMIITRGSFAPSGDVDRDLGALFRADPTDKDHEVLLVG